MEHKSADAVADEISGEITINLIVSNTEFLLNVQVLFPYSLLIILREPQNKLPQGSHLG